MARASGVAVTVVVAVSIAIGAGCARKREAASPPAPAREPAVAPAGTQPAPAAAPAAPAPPEPAYPRPQGPSAAGSEPTEDGTQSAAEPAAEDTKPPRDFSADLLKMLSGASSCVQPRPRDNAGAIAVSVTAYVMPGGAVSRGEIEAAQLQEDERACLRDRVGSLRFAPPIENAPFAVRTSLRITPQVRTSPKQVVGQQTDPLGFVVTQAPSGEGVSPGVVPPPDPGVVPRPDPGVVPPPDPGVVPPPDPPAEVMPFPSAAPTAP